MRPAQEGRRGGSVRFAQGIQQLISTSPQNQAATVRSHTQLLFLDTTSLQPSSFSFHCNQAKCLAEAREAKVLGREVPSVTEKSFVTTSKVSPSLPSAVWLAVVVSSVSQA